MAEQLICNQQVVGSTPTVGFRGGLSTDMKMGYCVLIEYVGVAQLDRASGYGPEGRGFESFSVHYILL